MDHEGDDGTLEKIASYAEVLEAVDGLPLDEQENLAEILHRRVTERGTEELAREPLQAQQEHEQGGCQPATIDGLLSEILA